MEEYKRERNHRADAKTNKNKLSNLNKFIRLIEVQFCICALVFLCVVGFKLTVGKNFEAIKTGTFDASYKLTNLYDLNSKLDNLARENKFVAFILGRKYIDPNDANNDNQENNVTADENTIVVQTSGMMENKLASKGVIETIDAKTPSLLIFEPEVYEINEANVLKIPALEIEKKELPEKIYYPVNNVITSPFGERVDPINGKRSFHTGIDIRAKEQTNVHSIMSGTVEKIGESSVWGNYIVVKHKNGFSSFYAHLEEILVEKDDKVSANKVIAHSGNTGRSTGPHLHFEIRYNDKYTDPCLYLEYTEK